MGIEWAPSSARSAFTPLADHDLVQKTENTIGNVFKKAQNKQSESSNSDSIPNGVSNRSLSLMEKALPFAIFRDVFAPYSNVRNLAALSATSKRFHEYMHGMRAGDFWKSLALCHMPYRYLPEGFQPSEIASGSDYRQLMSLRDSLFKAISSDATFVFTSSKIVYCDFNAKHQIVAVDAENDVRIMSDTSSPSSTRRISTLPELSEKYNTSSYLLEGNNVLVRCSFNTDSFSGLLIEKWNYRKSILLDTYVVPMDPSFTGRKVEEMNSIAWIGNNELNCSMEGIELTLELQIDLALKSFKVTSINEKRFVKALLKTGGCIYYDLLQERFCRIKQNKTECLYLQQMIEEDETIVAVSPNEDVCALATRSAIVIWNLTNGKSDLYRLRFEDVICLGLAFVSPGLILISYGDLKILMFDLNQKTIEFVSDAAPNPYYDVICSGRALVRWSLDFSGFCYVDFSSSLGEPFSHKSGKSRFFWR